MRASRGMGSINPSKMPKAKTIRRKDNPDDVKVFAKGGPTIPKKKRPPHKVAPPRLGKPFRNFRERIPSKEFS